MSAELKDAYNEFNLMRANCLADMNQIVALTATAVEAKNGDTVSALQIEGLGPRSMICFCHLLIALQAKRENIYFDAPTTNALF